MLEEDFARGQGGGTDEPIGIIAETLEPNPNAPVDPLRFPIPIVAEHTPVPVPLD